MNTMYTAILLILLLLTIYDLVVGVSNDASNFLNSSVGCKAAPRHLLLAIASVGVIAGAATSSGMMEVARSGVFLPHMFTFHEVMILFLAVMLTDVILLDIFNTLGLPTSTTVSLVFELLGAAIAAAIFSLCTRSEEGLFDLNQLGDYINSANALRIISGIFASVIVAFTCGCCVMWFSRLLFSFRWWKSYPYIGAVWCAVSLTVITCFTVFKGLSHSSILPERILNMLLDNVPATCGATALAWLVIASILQYAFRVNTLRLTVLAGTGALALAFAGNDLVNFIGAFMAAHSAFDIASEISAQGGSVSSLFMGALEAPVQANPLYLLLAGFVMVVALFFSQKARTVTETEVKLSVSKSSCKERFGSCAVSRKLVRSILNIINLASRLTPRPVARFVSKRFTPLPSEQEDGAAFDLVRGSVNLTVAALLISMATSLKLPLSTTYVTFMVAMGSSLADKAWGRDSAVYRVTGVLTVIGGWFLTGFAACTAAFISASIMFGLGFWGVGLMLAAAAAILIKSSFIHRNRKGKQESPLDLSDAQLLNRLEQDSARNLTKTLDLYHETIQALLQENRRELKTLKKSAQALNKQLRYDKEYIVLPTLNSIRPELADRGQFLFRMSESQISLSESLLSIVKSSYNHIDNNHTGLSEDQARELFLMSKEVMDFIPDSNAFLQTGSIIDFPLLQQRAEELDAAFSENITRHLIRSGDDEHRLRTSVLYLHLLNETRALVRRAFTLLKAEQELLSSMPPQSRQ